MNHDLAQTIAPRVLDFLILRAREFRAKGADLVLFGSFAQGRARGNSDLDIAIRWLGPRNSEVRREIVDCLDRAPTIRPIDLVDLQEVGQALQEEVESASVALADL